MSRRIVLIRHRGSSFSPTTARPWRFHMPNKKLKILLVGAASALALTCVAQSRKQPIYPGQASRFANAANRWMLQPIDIKKQTDTTTADNRHIRDEYWDRVAGQPTPLSQPTKTFIVNTGGGTGSTPAFAMDDFPVIRDGVWIVGKFDSYRTISLQVSVPSTLK